MSMAQNPFTQAKTRYVPCPCCGNPSPYSAGNAFRPFCSERCKKIDLGAWASEQFTLPLASQSDPNETSLN